MKLSPAPAKYDQADEQAVRNQIRSSDSENFKRGRDLRLQQGERIILMAPDGGLWAITVDNSGVLGTDGPL